MYLLRRFNDETKFFCLAVFIIPWFSVPVALCCLKVALTSYSWKCLIVIIDFLVLTGTSYFISYQMLNKNRSLRNYRLFGEPTLSKIGQVYNTVASILEATGWFSLVLSATRNSIFLQVHTANAFGKNVFFCVWFVCIVLSLFLGIAYTIRSYPLSANVRRDQHRSCLALVLLSVIGMVFINHL